MEYSTYQTNFFDAIGNSDRNLGLDAVAGSGKSTTLEHGVARINPLARTLMLAFNKNIADDLGKRMLRAVKKPVSLDVRTINSFGWGICRQAVRGVRLEAHKTERLLESQFDMQDSKQRNEFYKLKNPVDRLVTLLKANCVFEQPTDEKVAEIADNYGVYIDPKKYGLVSMIYGASMRLTNMMDFSDQVFMPIKNGWDIPQFDLTLGDEWQDATRMAQALVIKASRRTIVVGDKRQAIYGFAGADPQSLPNMIRLTNALELPLSICYRCPKSVIREAQKIVPHIEAWDQAPEGSVQTIRKDKFAPHDGDFVLCRTTAPLVSECLKAIREGKKAMVRGRDLGTQIIVLIDRLGVSDRDLSTRAYDALRKYHDEELTRLQRTGRTELIIALSDRVDTLTVLLESGETVGDVKARIKEIFQDAISGIVFMTCHRAKGLESTRVWILRPDLLPHPRAELPWHKEQEMNLLYVAVTRTKFDAQNQGELRFVEGQ